MNRYFTRDFLLRVICFHPIWPDICWPLGSLPHRVQYAQPLSELLAIQKDFIAGAGLIFEAQCNTVTGTPYINFHYKGVLGSSGKL